MQKRKTYDTRIKYLVRRGLLPDLYHKQIHRSLISKWKREPSEKYVGYELNGNLEELYELIKQISEDNRMQRVLKSFYRINKTLRDVIGTGRAYTKKLSEHKHAVISAIQHVKEFISLKRAAKMFGISMSTCRIWTMETFYHCGHSIIKLCSNSFPQQLTVTEIQKMHRLLSSKKYLHWPIVSVAYHGIRRSLVQAHPNTWYKYARLMKIKRQRFFKNKRTYTEGLRADAPNEKWHADITQLELSNGTIAYIYLVIDNFSRYIISWRIADRISARIRLDTFKETIHKTFKNLKTDKPAELIVDGGRENNNGSVETFIEKYPVEKYVALKDILFSNSLVESVNRTLKYNYLYLKQFRNMKQLRSHFKNYVIPDYNNKRPHAALRGLTPFEAYKSIQLDAKKMRDKMVQAFRERLCFNQTHECPGCPFRCKSGKISLETQTA